MTGHNPNPVQSQPPNECPKLRLQFRSTKQKQTINNGSAGSSVKNCFHGKQRREPNTSNKTIHFPSDSRRSAPQYHFHTKEFIFITKN
ncbi:hypothetical protein PRUPE_7G063300 [Prunus persica]|uniref:Uncharacterized protein n=1 Tax=Prunus persica TaxID=3760 RepID=A0A251NAN9_PRUPE|nr:hypothetical protein PRUPE_7G063300 [Prunus persica]